MTTKVPRSRKDFVSLYVDLRRLRLAHEEIVENEHAAVAAEQRSTEASPAERIGVSLQASTLRSRLRALWRRLPAIDQRPGRLGPSRSCPPRQDLVPAFAMR
jgi:hypothetical protein